MNSQSLSAYVMALAIALVFLLIAAVISNLIQFEKGSHPKDPGKRKMWFWILAILSPIIIFLIGFFVVRSGIKVPSARENYTTALIVGTGLSFIFYVVLGLILSKTFKHGKIGNWF